MLTKAGNAKEMSKYATALERIQLGVMESQGTTGIIDIELLNKSLKRINGLKYNGKELILDGENKNKIEELAAEVSLDGYNFFIEVDGQVSEMTISNLVNEKIGEVVQGYSAADLQWRVFYADPSETFLISDSYAKSGWAVPLRGEGKSSDYSGSSDVKKSKYGSKWNKKWLSKCTTESTYDNAKATAYLCDPDNWTDYSVGSASYAVGGPTIELFITSWNKNRGTNIQLNNEDIAISGFDGFKPSELRNNNPIRANISNGIYGKADYNNTWIASPAYIGRDSEQPALFEIWGGRAFGFRGHTADDNYQCVRPIVSIPTSKINIDGDTVIVLP